LGTLVVLHILRMLIWPWPDSRSRSRSRRFELPTTSEAVHAGGDDRSPLAGLSGLVAVSTLSFLWVLRHYWLGVTVEQKAGYIQKLSICVCMRVHVWLCELSRVFRVDQSDVKSSKKRPLFLVWTNPDPMAQCLSSDFQIIFKTGDGRWTVLLIFFKYDITISIQHNPTSQE